MSVIFFDLSILNASVQIRVDEEQQCVLSIQLINHSNTYTQARASAGGPLCRKVCRLLADYSRRPDADNARAMQQIPLDPVAGTDYQRQIREQVRAILPGETRSYADIARMTGRPRAARAIGQAMRTNPFSILVPCHRVIRADSTLGGWSSALSSGKSQLLQHEGAHYAIDTSLPINSLAAAGG